jgi:hypothetical protein
MPKQAEDFLSGGAYEINLAIEWIVEIRPPGKYCVGLE